MFLECLIYEQDECQTQSKIYLRSNYLNEFELHIVFYNIFIQYDINKCLEFSGYRHTDY